MINLQLRMRGLTAVALAGVVLIVACNNSGGGGSGSGSGGAGNTGDVIGLGNFDGKVNAVSGDGMVVVGQANINGASSDAFRWTQAGGMQLLGHLTNSKKLFSVARGVSEDGSVVVGGGDSSLLNEAFRWTQADGLVGLGVIAGVEPSIAYSDATAVSASGTDVVGSSRVGVSTDAQDNDFGFHSFNWTDGGGIVSTGDIPFGLVDAEATAFFEIPDPNVSSVVVGTGVSQTRTQFPPDPGVFRWHNEAFILRNGNIIPIGDLTGGFVLPGPFDRPGQSFSARTEGKCDVCSVDGEIAHDIDSNANDLFVRRAVNIFRTVVAVGASQPDNLPESLPEAFRWQESKNFTLVGVDFNCAQDAVEFNPGGGAPFDKLCMQGLGDLPGGLKFSEAKAISGLDPSLDKFLAPPLGEGGIVIVGYGHTAEGRRAFRWENTNIDLDEFPIVTPPADPTTPYDPGDPNRRIFFCDLDPTMPTPCMVELDDYLESLPNYKYEAFDPGDWTFVEATDISDDGDVIVGNGINPNGEEEGWIVRLTRK